ncbi:MAG: hypothetical protein AAFY34_04885 [Pseudomonadota bacterium]
MRIKPTREAIHAAMAKHGYKIFDSDKGYDVNIVGIRASDRVPDRFDDLMTVSYIQRSSGDWAFHAWPCTTDSGKAIMEKPVNKGGAAFLKPGQYRSSHMIRLHNSDYEAICQKWGTKLPVYRMNRLEEAINWKPSFTLFGNGTGINIHRATANYRKFSTVVGRWSAGCQVFSDPADFAVFMGICRAAREIWGNSFSYTLLDEADVAEFV